jgi:hypothetical protein
MGVDAAMPPGLFDRIRQMIRDETGKLLRSGLLRNASISEGGLTIKGGFLRMLSAVTGGVTSFYVGPIAPALPDGSYQPGFLVSRNDGTAALLLWDPIPDPGGPNGYAQFLGWYDRAGHAIVTDDTDSGTGIARPWIPLPMPVPNAIASWPNTSNTTPGNIAECQASLQQPKLWWNATTIADVGVTGTVALQIRYGSTTVTGPSHPIGASPSFINDIITLPSDFFGQQAIVDVVGNVIGGTGKVYCQTWALYGRQS